MISLSALTLMRLVLFYSDTHIRLTGHNTTHAGRVEVFSHGVWGRVLGYADYNWGKKEAAVVCRQLGFPGAITALRRSSFGEGSGPVLMSYVQCTGSEKTIQQCQYTDWIESSVFNGREVGVICKTHDFDPDAKISIRLQGSSVPNAGRVEVLYAGIWGAISRDSWDINDATVVCRQLGYQAGAEAALVNGVYGPISGPVWITNLQCSGNEKNLMSCSHDVIGNKSELQRSWAVASVICKDGSLAKGMPVRLGGTRSPNMGRVEVYYAGKWGSIQYGDMKGASVVCRQLGYSITLMRGYSLFCSNAVPYWFKRFNCYGNESSLDQCAWEFSIYSSYSYCANVMCKDKLDDAGLEVRLSGSPDPHAGRVQIRFKGVWGTIGCDDDDHIFRSHIDPELAQVICRQLNFTDSILASCWSVFGSGTDPQWFYNDEPQCRKDETNLLNCSYREPHLTRRRRYSDLSVVCKPDAPQSSDFPVRLTGSSLPHAGTIEVMYQGVWGGVLGIYIDINAGHVICHQLGYSGAQKTFYEATFGPVKGPLWIERIRCNGNETKISDCVVTKMDSFHRNHYRRPIRYSAGVICNEANSSASKDLNVRITGAPITNAGRVEVFYVGVWGIIGRTWDINAAHVVCRQLGYPGATSSGISNQFGIGTGPAWFENMKCLGNESNLGECLKDVSGSPKGSYHPATVLCKLKFRTDNFLNCSQVTCANKGTCIESAVGAICNCTNGFTGLSCEIPINPCQSRPCPNNTSCYSNKTHYYCVPNTIVTTNKNDNGTLLKDNETFNPCQSSPCNNGGKCFSNSSSFLCACPKGLTGKRCEESMITAIDPCQSYPCPKNTSCHHNETEKHLILENCPATLNPCQSSPCDNGGKCFSNSSSFLCACPKGPTGKRCEEPIVIETFNPCQSSPCNNGGKCFSNSSSFLCACPKGLTGKRCEEPIITAISPCQSQPCPNNTSCHHNETHYSCVPNDIQATPLKTSGKSPSTAEQENFNNPFKAVLTVSAAVILLLIAAVVYLIFRNRRRPKLPPSNVGTFKDDPENNHRNEEEAMILLQDLAGKRHCEKDAHT